MLKRLFISVLLGVVICGVTFYLGYFLALIIAALFGPINPANAPGVQNGLRHLLLPICLALGVVAAIVSYRRLSDEAPQRPKRDNILRFR